jgi:hypothetical protein
VSGIADRWREWYESEKCREAYGDSAGTIGRRMASELARYEMDVDNKAHVLLREREALEADKAAWNDTKAKLARTVGVMREHGVAHWQQGDQVVTLEQRGTWTMAKDR